MGGRLSLQRTTRALVPANFRESKTRPSPGLLAGAAIPGALRQGVCFRAAARKIYFRPKR